MIANNENLKNQFEHLGFFNFETFCKTANPLHDSEGVTLMYEMDDLYSDNDGLGYVILIRKEETNRDWEIHSIRVVLQMDTISNIEGVLVLSKAYSVNDGPLPPKEQIRTEVLEKARKERINDLFYFLQNRGGSVYKWFRRSEPPECRSSIFYQTTNMNKNDLAKGLIEQIEKLGFKFENLDLRLDVSPGMVYLDELIKPSVASLQGYTDVTLLRLQVNNPSEENASIHSLFALIGRVDNVSNEVKETSQLSFFANWDIIPHREQIVTQLQRTLYAKELNGKIAERLGRLSQKSGMKL